MSSIKYQVFLPDDESSLHQNEIKIEDNNSFFKGGNGKNILFLISSEDKLQNSVDLALFDKIIDAINLTYDDFVLINIHESPIQTFRNIQKSFLPEKVVSFGVSPEIMRLNICIKYHQIACFSNIRMLFSHNLETLKADAEKKKLLWKALQEMFLQDQ